MYPERRVYSFKKYVKYYHPKPTRTMLNNSLTGLCKSLLRLSCCLWLVLFAQLGHTQAPVAWPTKEWQTSTPEAEGMDSAALSELYNYLATAGFNTDSVLVIRHGRIVSETYVAPFNAELRHDLRSVTKSVVATLVGVALQEGRIASLDQKVLSFFPDQPANSSRQEALTVRHLLDMASGIQWREHPYDEQSDALKLWRSPDWVKFILDRQLGAVPGEKFSYIAADPHLLSVILTRSTGDNAAKYAREGLFKTLGIDDFVWRADPKGNTIGESSLRLKTRDMAKLGLLYARRGRWGDRQLLPPGWTDAVFAGGLPNGNNPLMAPPTYSRLWWTDASVPYAAALGRHGQNIIVLPDQDIVLVVTSKTADTSRRSSAVDMVKRYLLPAIKGRTALQENPDGRVKLAHAMRRLGTVDQPEPQQPSPQAEALSKRIFDLEPNAWQLLEFALELSPPNPSVKLEQATKTFPYSNRSLGGAIGLHGDYVVSQSKFDGPLAMRGRWINETTFRAETQYLEGAIILEWTAEFADGELKLSYVDGDSRAFKTRGKPKD
jgi:CubicO group peptidase (beta-lactamase class C family)